MHVSRAAVPPGKRPAPAAITAATDTGGEVLRIRKAVYGGDGLAHTAAGEVVFVPFALPGELVEVSANDPNALRISEPSPDRVEPRCIHFGRCGGCQYQMAGYGAQLAIKEAILRETLQRAGIEGLPPLTVWASPQPWEYRNRIRLRVRTVDGVLRLGYSLRGTQEFLPVQMCPIATPILWCAAEALMEVAAALAAAAAWLRSAAEVDIGCDERGETVQIHLLCPGKDLPDKAQFRSFADRVKASGLALAAMSASRLHTASGRPTQLLAAWGADGLAYKVGEDRFWLERGSFFQVNRLLIPQMRDVVVGNRQGGLAWDLYAGVGLFTRALTGRFAQVTAIEANPLAVRELRRGLRRRPGDQSLEMTTVAFLRGAVLQRDRPDLIVLDPPRAGAGGEACALLARLRPAEIVYVSCDPTTLARDVATLLAAGYAVAEWHLLDLFPQTYHLETVMVLRPGM